MCLVLCKTRIPQILLMLFDEIVNSVLTRAFWANWSLKSSASKWVKSHAIHQTLGSKLHVCIHYNYNSKLKHKIMPHDVCTTERERHSLTQRMRIKWVCKVHGCKMLDSYLCIYFIPPCPPRWMMIIQLKTAAHIPCLYMLIYIHLFALTSNIIYTGRTSARAHV